MGLFDRFPYTNFHELNLDWIIGKIRSVDTAKEECEEIRDATAVIRDETAIIKTEAQASADSAALQAANAGIKAAEAAASAAGIEAARQQINTNTARIDNILVQGTPTEGNAELIDIRVGATGETYASAGDSVRGQISDTRDTFGPLARRLVFTDWEQGSLDANGNEVNSGLDYPLRIRTGFIDMQADSSFIHFTPENAGCYLAVCFYDLAHNFISRTGWNNTEIDLPISGPVVRILAYKGGQLPITPADSFPYHVDLIFDIFRRRENIVVYTLNSGEWVQGSLDANGQDVDSGLDYPLRIRTDFFSMGVNPSIRFVPSSTDWYLACCFYDEDNNFISRTAWTDTAETITPAGPKVRFVGRKENQAPLTPADASNFGVTISYKIVTAGSPWTGKKWVAFGDSVTAMNLWEPYVVGKTDINCLVLGHGGARIAYQNTAGSSPNGNWLGQDAYINAIPVDADLITVMGGTNDFGEPPAQIIPASYDLQANKFDPVGFQNGLAEIVRKIYLRAPGAQVVLMSLTGGQFTSAEYQMPQRVNSLGYTGEDYANATKEVADLLNLPYIPVWNDGINVFNRSLYISDTVHPNEEGAKQIARLVIGWMNANEPIV
jgi:lysophospholipase L1-like esterase